MVQTDGLTTTLQVQPSTDPIPAGALDAYFGVRPFALTNALNGAVLLIAELLLPAGTWHFRSNPSQAAGVGKWLRWDAGHALVRVRSATLANAGSSVRPGPSNQGQAGAARLPER